MKKVTLDENILLGGVILDESEYQLVHLNLKKGNQTDDYSNSGKILILNISGKITVAVEEKVEILNKFEIIEIEKNTTHIITCLEDAQVVVIKFK